MNPPPIPVLIFPQGSELVSSKILEVSWDYPRSYSGQYSPIGYFEIAIFSGSELSSSEESWRVIARISSDSKFYRWIIPEFVFGSKIKIGLRSVSFDGFYSDFAESGYLSIASKPLPKPAVSSPVVGKKYGSQIKIIIENPYLEEDFLKMNRFRSNFYYSSDSSDVSFAPIAERVPGSISEISWDTSGLSSSEDYFVHVFYSDDYGKKGPQISVGPFTIENQGYILIDTDAPDVAVKVNSINGYSRDRTIGIEIFASDDITGIHGMKLIENQRKQDGTLGDSNSSEPRFFQRNNYFQLKDEDATYVISALVQDLSGNRSSTEDFSNIKQRNRFRKFYSRNSYKITAWAKSYGVIYISLYNGSFSQIVKIENSISTVVTSFQGYLVAMGYSLGRIYGSRANDQRSFDLVYIDASGVSEISSSGIGGTEISAIGFSGGLDLLVGCIDGSVYKVSGENVVFIGNIESSVYAIDTGDLGKAFILGQSSDKIFVYSNNKLFKVDIAV